ncbi:hypothetical protein EBU99_07150 [bacterium]|nr:hypothetical protein [bacterium]
MRAGFNGKSSIFAIAYAGLAFSANALASDNNPLFTIDGKIFAPQDLTPAEQARLYELENNRFKAVESLARQHYVEEKIAKYVKLNSADKPFAAEEKWLNKSFTPTQAEVDKSLETFKNEKQLQDLPAAERAKVMVRYLSAQNRVKALTEATDKAIEKGEIKVAVRAPQAPVIDIKQSSQATLGDAKAAIRVVEFTDFQCPYCRKLSSVTQEVLRKHGASLNWEVRHFPLSFHKHARSAAAAVYCASLQGKLADAKKWVFEAQDKLGDEKFYADMSKALALKSDSFDKCRSAESTEKLIAADIAEGERVGVQGTPSVFVNGRRFEGDVHSLEAWDNLIQSIKPGSKSVQTL